MACLSQLLSSFAFMNTGFTLSWRGEDERGTDWFQPWWHHSLNITNVLVFFFERALGDPYQVDVTQLVQPEVVDGSCNCWEVVRFECSITQTNSCAQSRQNPPVWYALLSAQLSRRKRKEMKSVHLPSLFCVCLSASDRTIYKTEQLNRHSNKDVCVITMCTA